MESSNRINVSCPFCRSKLVESTAKSPSVRGFIFAFQLSSRTLIGCKSCVRVELVKEAARSAVLGWFSITALILNPILIVYNVVRALAVRTNPDAVSRRLREAGYDIRPSGPDRLQAGYALAAGIVAADGSVDPEKVTAAVMYGNQLFGEFDATRFEEICRTQAGPGFHESARALREVLSVGQKETLFRYLLTIAQADGELSPAEQAQLGAAAEGLNLDLDAWNARLAAEPQSA